MRRASRFQTLLRMTALVALLAAMSAPFAHAAQHADGTRHTDADDCLVCLAHSASPVLVRDVVPRESPNGFARWAAPEQQSTLLHAGHGAPFSGRAPPVFPA